MDQTSTMPPVWVSQTRLLGLYWIMLLVMLLVARQQLHCKHFRDVRLSEAWQCVQQQQAEEHLLALLGAHALDLLVAVHNAEQVEQLALVLVDALDLDVHEGLGVEVDAGQLLDLLHRLLLGLQLHGLPLALELLVICLLLQSLAAHSQFSIVQCARPDAAVTFCMLYSNRAAETVECGLPY